MKTKFDLDDELPLNKTIKICSMIVLRLVLHENNTYHAQVFLDECLYKLWKIYYDRIEVPEEIDINETSRAKECEICHYWYLFLNFWS